STSAGGIHAPSSIQSVAKTFETRRSKSRQNPSIRAKTGSDSRLRFLVISMVVTSVRDGSVVPKPSVEAVAACRDSGPGGATRPPRSPRKRKQRACRADVPEVQTLLVLMAGHVEGTGVTQTGPEGRAAEPRRAPARRRRRPLANVLALQKQIARSEEHT